LRRVDEVLASRPSNADVTEHSKSDYLQRLVVRDGTRFVFVRIDDLSWIQADENYVVLHADERLYQARLTMKELQDKLNPRNFARIHRSFIVNIDRIKEVLSPPHEDRKVVLRDGTVLPVGRAYTGRLLS
jgi:two-component system, LytTR family, response regulator